MIRSRIRRSRTLSVRPRPYRSKLSATRISAGCLRFLILSKTLERLTRAMLFREVWNYKFTHAASGRCFGGSPRATGLATRGGAP